MDWLKALSPEQMLTGEKNEMKINIMISSLSVIEFGFACWLLLSTDATTKLNCNCFESFRKSPVVSINSKRTILESAFILYREAAQKNILLIKL